MVEGDDADPSRRLLHFKLSQNDSVSFDSREFVMPMSARSMAGYVALHNQTLDIDDVYEMPAGSPFGFDRSFDEKIGYRTKSMLVTPLALEQGRGHRRDPADQQEARAQAADCAHRPTSSTTCCPSTSAARSW